MGSVPDDSVLNHHIVILITMVAPFTLKTLNEQKQNRRKLASFRSCALLSYKAKPLIVKIAAIYSMLIGIEGCSAIATQNGYQEFLEVAVMCLSRVVFSRIIHSCWTSV